jgi:hypothetical protein
MPSAQAESNRYICSQFYDLLLPGLSLGHPEPERCKELENDQYKEQ